MKQLSKMQIARKLKTLPGDYRVRTYPGWGCWVWEYKMRGDNMQLGWLSVCKLEDAERYFWGVQPCARQ